MRFEVEVARTRVETVTVTVDARDAEEAKAKALDAAEKSEDWAHDPIDQDDADEYEIVRWREDGYPIWRYVNPDVRR